MTEDAPLLLPEGTRLVYIGPPKTGTTSLQYAAQAARERLYEQGVYYPGDDLNHRRPVFALMNRPDHRENSTLRGAKRGKAQRIPPKAEWDDLVRAVEQETARRVLISHESMSRSSSEMAETVVNEFGRNRTHVVITLRAPVALLPGRWTELLKEGLTDTFTDWLKRLYDPETTRPLSEPMMRYLDQAGLVERWAAAAGVENVTVVIVDKTNKTVLSDAFERMLGLPNGELANNDSAASAANRSLTRFEADVLQQANANLRAEKVPWALYDDTIYQGVVPRWSESRALDSNEPKVRMPQWAEDNALRDGRLYADRIADSGVRIVGNLESLYRRPSGQQEPIRTDTDRKFENIAIEAVTGAVCGAVTAETQAANWVGETRKRYEVEKRARQDLKKTADKLAKRTIHDQVKGLSSTKRVQTAVQSFSTRELLRALNMRLRYKIRTGKSKPLK